MNKKIIQKLAKEYGTPLLIIDHERIRKNYKEFRKHLPRVQIYYAIKANSDPEIIKTLLNLGSSFDVASLNEFNLIFEQVKHLEPVALQNFIWNNIIYANPVKKPDSLHVLNLYKPLLTYDSIEEMKKIKVHSPDAGLLLRIKISDQGSVVRFSNKFGIEPDQALNLIKETKEHKMTIEGISFHVGSQCNQPANFVKALRTVAHIFRQAAIKGYEIGETVTKGFPIKIVDIGGGFPVKYKGNEQSFEELASIINREIDRLFPKDDVLLLAEPGRFLVANAGTAVSSVVLAKHSQNPPSYHIDDGIYQTFSAMIYDHVPINVHAIKKGPLKECRLFGPTCDGLDTLSENEYIKNTGKIFLPDLYEGDLVYTENMGAYTTASSTHFNGMPPAKVVHINL